MKTVTIRRWSMLIFMLLSILFIPTAVAQCGSTCGPNLVPNPSFESTTACGGGNNLLYTNISPVKDWWGLVCSTCPSSGAGGGDYLNSNCPGTNATLNCGDGKGAIGMFTTYAGRESVQAQLTGPLLAGHQYCFSMRVRSNNISPASNGIGAWFHNKGKLNADTDNNGNTFLGTGTKLNVTPQVQNPTTTMIGNTCVTVSGTFCATGDESWIVISNFRTDAGTKVGNGNGLANGGYLIIDELSLRETCVTSTPITTSADSVCPNSCVTLTANPTGTGPFRYKWTPGTAADTLKTFQACPITATTKYKCTITTQTGCAVNSTQIDSINIYFKKYIPVPTITTSSSSTICAGDTIILTCTPAAPNYKWSTGATTQSIKVTTAGLYSVTVKHPYSGCNSTSAATNVVVNTLPVLNLSSLKNDSTNCDKPTGSIKGITATGAPTLTYSWNSNPVQTTPDLIDVKAGVYTLTVTDGNGCKKTVSAQIFNKPNPPAPTIDLTSTTTTVCTENDIKLSIKNPLPGYTYTWTQLPNTVKGTGDVLILKNAKIIDAGVYQVTATKFGCEGAGSTIKITVNQTPDTVVVKAVTGTVCEGTKAILFVNPPVDPNLTYKWISPDSPNTPDVINDSLIIDKVKLKDAGTYKLIATSKLSCPSHDAHIKLEVDSAAKSSKVNLSSAIVCEGDTVAIKPATPIAGVTYKIYVKSSTGADSLVGIAPLSVVPHKTTKYYMDAVSSKGCSQLAEKDTATIGVYTAPIIPVVSASDSVICDNDTTTIFVFNPVSGVTYKVYDVPVSGTGYNTPYNVVLHKTTTFYVEAISSKGCKQITGRKPITIKVNPLPARPKITVESKTGDKLCSGETIKLSSSIPNNITWLPGNLHTPAINITKGGLYTLYFTDPNGCNSYKDSANITLVEPPKLDLSKYGIDTIKCGETTGGIHGLIINSGTGPFTYNWYNVNDPSKTVSTDLILKGVPTGKYSLIVKDKNGCTDVLNNAFIPTNGGIIVRLSATPDAGVAPLNTLATATTSGNRPIDYVWWLDGVNKGTTNEKTNTFPFGPLAFGTHVIQVNVRDSSQCKSVDYLTITVLTSVKILDVNIFTPNNDGHNDILIFPMEGVQTLQGSIFDRWGLKLFEWSGAETGWDGNDLSGKPVPEGTYYYILKTTDVYGGSRVKSGYVELIRD